MKLIIIFDVIRDQGKFKDAVVHLYKALAIREKICGKNDTSVSVN